MPVEQGRAFARAVVEALPPGEEVVVEFSHQKVAIYRPGEGPVVLQLMERTSETVSLSAQQLMRGAGFLLGLAEALPQAQGEGE